MNDNEKNCLVVYSLTKGIPCLSGLIPCLLFRQMHWIIRQRKPVNPACWKNSEPRQVGWEKLHRCPTFGMSGAMQKDAPDLGWIRVCSFPSPSSQRYTQGLPSQKCRHTGMEAGIQAMDGNLMVWHLPDLTAAQADRLPSLGAGLAHHIPVVRASPRTPCVQIRSRRICRHPCRNDVSPTLVYNEGISAWERSI